MFSRLHLDFSAMFELMVYGEMKSNRINKCTFENKLVEDLGVVARPYGLILVP